MNARVYCLEIEMHRERVKGLATVVYELIPGYSAIPVIVEPEEISMLQKYLALHDAPKVQNLEQLVDHGYRHDLSIAERLSAFYGFNRAQLPSDQSQALNQLIEELNELECQQKQQFFAHYEIEMNQREKFSRAEMIADVTDTGIARQDEMGLSGESYNGNRFLLERGDFVGAELSRWLEDNYRQILKDQLS